MTSRTRPTGASRQEGSRVGSYVPAVHLSLVVAMLVLVSCRGSEAASTARTESSVAQAATATGPFDPPAAIDEDYINQVLAELARIEGDAVRELVATRSFSPEFLAVIRALYLDEWLLDARTANVADDFASGFEGYRAVPGDRSVLVTKVVSARADCIYVEARRNSSALATKDLPSVTDWIALAPVPLDRDPFGRNQTGWGYSIYGHQQGGGAPPDPCQP